MKKIFCTFPDGKSEFLTEKKLRVFFQFIYTNKITYENFWDFFLIKMKMKKFLFQKKIPKESVDLGKIYGSKINTFHSPKVSIRWISEEVGYGLFAEEDLEPSVFIGEYTGVLRNQKEYLRMNDYLHEYELQSLTGNYYAIDAEKSGNETRFMNHSSIPNVKPIHIWKSNLFHKIFLTTKAVKKGEQLCYDYGVNYWNLRKSPINLL